MADAVAFFFTRYLRTRSSHYYHRKHVHHFCVLEQEISSEANLFSSD